MVEMEVLWFMEHSSLLNLKLVNPADIEGGHNKELVSMFSFRKTSCPLFCQNGDLLFSDSC